MILWHGLVGFLKGGNTNLEGLTSTFLLCILEICNKRVAGYRGHNCNPSILGGLDGRIENLSLAGQSIPAQCLKR